MRSCSFQDTEEREDVLNGESYLMFLRRRVSLTRLNGD